MKKYNFTQLLNLLGMPVLLIVLGLILLFSPDTASALVGKVLAWAGILAGIAFLVNAFAGDPVQKNNRIIFAVVCFAAGLWLLMNPLFPAKFIGRVLGLFLLLRGGQDIRVNLQYSHGKIKFTPGLIIAGVTALAGIVLMVLPMASSRLLFAFVGIVMICAGAAEAYDRIKGPRLLDEGDDPDIIDAL